VGLEEFPVRPEGRIWRYPDGMADYIQRILRDTPAIIHIHGVWFAPQWLAARTAKQKAVPAILTTHGQLRHWHWQDGRLRRIKKLAYWFSLAYPAFRQVTVIHTLTAKERDELAQSFPGQRLEVIPNALDLGEIDRLLSDPGEEPAPQISSPYILFLGRLGPQKGVDVLIEAFTQAVKGRDFRLVLAGPEYGFGYADQLRAAVQKSGLESQVIFLGPVFGLGKWRLFQNAWACCLPSRSEGMSMVSLEAAAAGTPLVTTYEAGVLDWQGNGGLLVHPQVEEVAKALDQVFSWGDRERQDRGRQLRQLVERRYSWKVVGPQWLDLYDELAGRD
jgi:glycosyltransferase involved in cell wall biosynthesis